MMKRSIITSFFMIIAMAVTASIDAMKKQDSSPNGVAVNIPEDSSSKRKLTFLSRLVPGKKCMLLAALVVAAGTDCALNGGAGMTWVMSFFPTQEAALAWLSVHCPEAVTEVGGNLALVARENMPGWLVTAGKQLVDAKSWIAAICIAGCNSMHKWHSNDRISSPVPFAASGAGTHYTCDHERCMVTNGLGSLCHKGQTWVNPGNGSQDCLWLPTDKQP